MWSTFLLLLASIPFAILVFFIGLIADSAKTGGIAALVTIFIFSLIAMIHLFRLKTLSYADCFFPILVGSVWSLLLMPLRLAEADFSAPAAIGSSMFLSLSLWQLKKTDFRQKGFLVFPLLVFIYEMLPINIPGPVDDILAFGGQAVYQVFLFLIKKNVGEMTKKTELLTQEKK